MIVLIQLQTQNWTKIVLLSLKYLLCFTEHSIVKMKIPVVFTGLIQFLFGMVMRIWWRPRNPGRFIMRERVVRVQWECPRKMEQHFPIKPGHPRGMAVTLFFLFPNSLHQWWDVEQWTGLSKWNSKSWLEYSDQNIRNHLHRWARIFRLKGIEAGLSIWFPTKISGIFGIMESVPRLSLGGHLIGHELVPIKWFHDRNSAKWPLQTGNKILLSLPQWLLSHGLKWSPPCNTLGARSFSCSSV